MNDLLDLDRYPLDQPASAAYATLVATCRREMTANGMFNLDGFVRTVALERAIRELEPLCDAKSYTHQRRHNVYFDTTIDDVAPNHGALTQFDTINHTLCDDQLPGTVVRAIYEWQPLPEFLAQVLDKPRLHLMSDPLARVNVLEYRPGEALNWHFDRSRFTTTLLIQAAEQGGEFEFRSGLRSEADPNYEGVAKLLKGEDSSIQVNPLAPGTLNVFAGKNTLHRISTVSGRRRRLVAVYSYYEKPNVEFSPAERIGFYGRAG